MLHESTQLHICYQSNTKKTNAPIFRLFLDLFFKFQLIESNLSPSLKTLLNVLSKTRHYTPSFPQNLLNNPLQWYIVVLRVVCWDVAHGTLPIASYPFLLSCWQMIPHLFLSPFHLSLPHQVISSSTSSVASRSLIQALEQDVAGDEVGRDVGLGSRGAEESHGETSGGRRIFKFDVHSQPHAIEKAWLA